MEGHKYMVRNLEHLLCKRLEELGLFREEREGILFTANKYLEGEC